MAVHQYKRGARALASTIIEIRNLSKQYRIGLKENDYKTFREALVGGLITPIRNWRRLRRLTKFDTEGDYQQTNADEFSARDVIWALKDVSFEVHQGEVLGIIGRNGAGKSTLLKVLSRITEPSRGDVWLYGRISSLLEVGTGFHPELTGRENIYLNGAILGMKKNEIKRKFDEIVEFAEVERFIDTPVKHYSSGMSLRLAFAVAAYLEPEILVVDEVLAVGDAAFRKKCLGKMEDVTKEGRTLLFVSHDMSAIQNLCPRTILIDKGRVMSDGPTHEVIATYLKSLQELAEVDLTDRADRRGEGKVRFTKIEILDKNYRPVEYPRSKEKIIIRLHYKSKDSHEFRRCRASISVMGYGHIYFLLSTELVNNKELIVKDEGFLDCIIGELPLSGGEYYLCTYLETNKIEQDYVEAAARISVVDGDFYGTGRNYAPGWAGLTVLVRHQWEWK